MTPRGEQQLITELQVISQYLMRIANSLEKKAGEDPIAVVAEKSEDTSSQ